MLSVLLQTSLSACLPRDPDLAGCMKTHRTQQLLVEFILLKTVPWSSFSHEVGSWGAFFAQEQRNGGLRKEPDGALNPGLSHQALGAASFRLHSLRQPKGPLQEPKDPSVVLRTWEACPANGSLVT